MITGKGMYIWIVQRCGEPRNIALAAWAMGLSHMLVKIADGPYIYYGADDWYDHSRDWSMELVHELKAVGIVPVGWQYVYGIVPEAEANIAAKRILEGGIEYFDIDAEKEYKAPGMGPKAVAYCSRLRTLVHDIKIGLGTYRYPTLHATMPWAEFGQYMDFYMPQVYWAGSHNPVEQLGRCLREYAKLPYPRVVYPTGAAYREFGWQPGAGEVTAFMKAARDIYKLQAANLWEWYDAKLRFPGYTEELAAIDYGIPVQPPPPQPPPPVTVPEHVKINNSDGLNIRLEADDAQEDLTVIGKAYNGKIYHPIGIVLDAKGRKWYKLGEGAFIASWLTVLP